MKKTYIIPNARVISLCEEHELMQTGSPQLEQKEGEIDDLKDVMSNRRNSIWGYEE